MNHSLLAQTDGAICITLGSSWRTVSDVHGESKQTSHHDRIGPGPAPWKGRPLLCRPRPEAAVDFALQMAAELACGLFIGQFVEDDEGYRAALGDAVVWSILLEVPTEPEGVLMAHYVDFTFEAHSRSKLRSDMLEVCGPELLMLSPLKYPPDTGFNKIPSAPFWNPRARPPTTPRAALPGIVPPPTAPMPSPDSGVIPRPPTYNVNEFRACLRANPYTPCATLADTVSDMLENGAGKLQYPGCSAESENLPSLRGQEDATREQLSALADDGIVSGPHTTNPIPGGHVNAMGLAEKGSAKWLPPTDKATSKKRIFLHTSHPPELAVNLWSLGIRLFMIYFTQAHLLAAIADYGPHTHWLCFDIRRAYHTLSNRFSDLWGFIVKIGTKTFGVEYWIYLANVFGWVDSEASWQAFAAILVWIIVHDSGMPLSIRLHAYVDNFFLAILSLNGRVDHVAVSKASAALKRIIASLGIDAHEETSGPDMPGLGWLWHGGAHLSVSTTQAKLDAVLFLLEKWTARPKGKVSVAEVRSGEGLFAWLSTVMIDAKPYLWEFRRLSSGGKRLCTRLKLPAHKIYIHLSATALQGVATYIQILRESKLVGGVPIHPGRRLGAFVEVLIRQDGCTSYGCGGVNFASRQFFSHRWDDNERAAAMREVRESSGHCEARGCVYCARLWFPLHPHSTIVIEVDASNVKDAWLSGFSPVLGLNKAMTELRHLASRYYIHLIIRHIPREYNHVADRASEGKLGQFLHHLAALVGHDEARLFQRVYAQAD